MASEEIEIRGHIIDSLIFSKILDELLNHDCQFDIKQVNIGRGRTDPSYARIEVSAEDEAKLEQILVQLARHGAAVRREQNACTVPAPADGVFPDGFYSTTNQRTQVRLSGRWVEVAEQEMDCGIVIADGQPRCVPLNNVRKGQLVVTGHRGVRVLPLARPREYGLFEFMSSSISTEKPKGVMVRQIAEQMQQVRSEGGKILVVAGPAVVHTGSSSHLVRLIEQGYVQKLFAGNALAVHDVEQALYGTSLGIYTDRAVPAEKGHEHHLRAINTIRKYGSLVNAIEAGVLTSGIMHACITHNVEFILAGSIRDDGPLPEVITDTMVAQQRMREAVRDVDMVLIIATMLHGIATGNLLPAWVRVVCVDISPEVVTKLADRGTFQTVGMVTDVEPFLRVLTEELQRLEQHSRQ